MSGKFLKSIEFNVNFNTFTGHYVPDFDQVITSSQRKTVLIFWRIFGDLCSVITVVTLSIRLLSFDVPVAERCIGVFTTITAIQGGLKCVHFVVNKQRFEKLFELLDESLDDIPCREEHEKTMLNERRRVKIITTMLIALMAGPAIPWGLLPFLPSAQEVHGGRYLAVPAWFPFDSLSTPMFEMVLVFQTLGAWFTISRSVTHDAFFISIASFKIVQASNLKTYLSKMFDLPAGENVANFDDISSENVFNYNCDWRAGLINRAYRLRNNRFGSDMSIEQQKRLYARRIKSWVQYHQKIANVGREIQSLYSSIFVMQLLTSLLILCFSSFVAATVSLDLMQYLLSGIFCFGNIIQLFLLCQYGDRVTDADLALSDAAFANGWHKCHIKGIQSSLKIIYHRVQIPLQLSAWGVFPLSSVTFLDITKTAFSYLTVLIELYKKQLTEKEGKSGISH